LPAVDGARLHRIEDEAAFGVGAGADAAEALEAGVRAALVERMRVAALVVRLPDLDHGVGDRVARAVEHAALDTDALALGLWSGEVAARDAGEWIVVLLRRQTVREEGADRLRRRLFEGHGVSPPSASRCARAGRCRIRSRARNRASSRRWKSGRRAARGRRRARSGRWGRDRAADRRENTSA